MRTVHVVNNFRRHDYVGAHHLMVLVLQDVAVVHVAPRHIQALPPIRIGIAVGIVPERHSDSRHLGGVYTYGILPASLRFVKLYGLRRLVEVDLVPTSATCAL